MNLLRAYLVEGRSVRDIAADLGTTEPGVRAALGQAGNRVEPGQVRDTVCAAIAWRGLGSFAAFARKHGMGTLKRQAATLGVPVAALKRIHDTFKQLAVAEAQVHDDSEPQRA